MKINADFSQRVVLHTNQIEWVETRMKGVKRRMLDRVGAETGHATSIVSYDPDSKFSAHVHTGGEEFIVLSGVFQDEHGDFPAGSYIRNPPTSSHTPGSDKGCVIFVKLWQFEPQDRNHVRMRFDLMNPIPAEPGVQEIPLYRDDREEVRVVEWAPGTQVTTDLPGGAELLVLEGSFADGPDTLDQHAWLRVPTGGKLQATAGPEGAKIWIKTGHMRFAQSALAK